MHFFSLSLMSSADPGQMVEFEKAPFKLTQDHVDVMMLGAHGACYQQFLALCIKGYLLLRKHSDKILTLVKAMQAGSPLPCLEGGQKTLTEVGSVSDRAGMLVILIEQMMPGVKQQFNNPLCATSVRSNVIALAAGGTSRARTI